MTISLYARASMMTATSILGGGPGSGPQGGGGDSSAGSSGGSSGGSSSGSGGNGSSSSAATHSVKLPKDPSKLNISQTNKAFDQMGMKLGAGKSSVVNGTFVTTYSVTMSDGSVKSMGTDEMKSLIYSGADT